MITFDFKKYKDQRVAMHCKTEQEAKEFCEVMHNAGFKWCNGQEYINQLLYNTSKNNTYYWFNQGTYSEEVRLKKSVYKILEWSEERMIKEFTKDDLKTGMFGELDDGELDDRELFVVVNNKLIFQSGTCCFLGYLYPDLSHGAYRINKVCYADSFKEAFENLEQNKNIIYDRNIVNPIIEITLEEIAKLKGVDVKQIKIVKGE